ncbi:MAG: hypothetical protein IJN74_03765 [Clostridia bacterium]|nr:hypothetical protein [Clostridia bacterium]
MEITYYTNGVITSKSLAEWFFGTKTVENSTASAVQQNKNTGEKNFKFWQDGTGYLGIQIG